MKIHQWKSDVLKATGIAAVLALSPAAAYAGMGDDDTLAVRMFEVNDEGSGESIGTIHIQEYEDGVLFKPDLKGLEPGLHGFHMHENPSCDPAEKNGKMTPGAAAGGHSNPDNGGHNGPFAEGHEGDLPALYVDEDGNATHDVFAPRLDDDDLKGHALMIHADGDNYSDQPKPLGGGGDRVACGVIK